MGYLSGLAVALLILLMGLELAKSSIERSSTPCRWIPAPWSSSFSVPPLP
ncbi:MAG: hypothetical protein V8R40_04240 [Dysosmobacter sp.]